MPGDLLPEPLRLDGIIFFQEFAGIMSAIHEIFVNPVKYRNKSRISVRKLDFRVTMREISGITTDFRDFLSSDRTHERMDIFYPAKFIAGTMVHLIIKEYYYLLPAKFSNSAL